ncbi:MAG: hypothetical protein NT027_19750 [Proteobacteria bacterium]|nr:hypothetical protein [Pseudomonadota bacterium]
MKNSKPNKMNLLLIWLVPMTIAIAGAAQGATVHSCTSSGERCVVKVEDGIVGDKVKVLDDKARPIATGRIVKRKGNYAVISVSDSSRTIRRGYPVIVSIDSRSSSLQWAASHTSAD